MMHLFALNLLKLSLNCSLRAFNNVWLFLSLFLSSVILFVDRVCVYVYENSAKITSRRCIYFYVLLHFFLMMQKSLTNKLIKMHANYVFLFNVQINLSMKSHWTFCLLWNMFLANGFVRPYDYSYSYKNSCT